MTKRISLMMVSLLVALTQARASEFDDFRIPDHRLRDISGGVSFFGRQGIQSAGSERRQGLAAGELFGNASWLRDSEKLRLVAAGAFNLLGSRRGDEEHSRDDIPPFFSTADREANARSTGEAWSIELQARHYPWATPVGFELRFRNAANYTQDWSDQLNESRLTGPPVNNRFEQQIDGNRWTYSYFTSMGAAVGWGRVRDATGVYDARLLEERLQHDGVLARPLSADARSRLAQLFYLEPSYQNVHDLSDKFFWREVEKILSDDGALGAQGLDAYAVLHAQQPYAYRALFSGTRQTRLSGNFLALRFVGDYRNEIERVTNHRYQAYFDADTVVNSEHMYQSMRNVSSVRSPLIGLGAECHVPFDMRWQLDTNTEFLADTRGFARRTAVNTNLRLVYLIADRWFADLGLSQARSIRRERGNDHGEDVWFVSYQAGVGYYLEDRIRLGLTVGESQMSQLHLGGVLDVYGRNQYVSLAITYSLLRGLDAPGVVGAVRPVN